MTELVCNDPNTRGTVLSSFPGLRIVYPDCAALLGSPLGDGNSLDNCITDKIIDGRRLHHLHSHDAIIRYVTPCNYKANTHSTLSPARVVQLPFFKSMTIGLGGCSLLSQSMWWPGHQKCGSFRTICIPTSAATSSTTCSHPTS